MFRTNIVSATYMQLETAAETAFVQKNCTFNVDVIGTKSMIKYGNMNKNMTFVLFLSYYFLTLNPLDPFVVS